MSKPIQFTHDFEYDAQSLPSAQEAIQAASEFIKDVKIQWTKGKQYQAKGQVVHTYNTRKGIDFWMSRVSHHPSSSKLANDQDITFEVFQKYLLYDHTTNEREYVELLESFRTNESDSRIPASTAEGWKAITVHYKFPRLFTDREMAVWLLCVQPDPEVKQFYVISLPSTHSVSDKATRSVYCAIEVVTFKEEEGHIEWIMAQTSDARGNIPRWIQDKSVTATVVDDVPSFITWAIKKVKKEKS